MKVVLQRVERASVTVDGEIVSRIGRGILILLGVHRLDTPAEADFLAEKCSELRLFPDAEGRMNLSVTETGGAALVVSQFTLLGECRKGRRPNFTEAAGPELAVDLYGRFVAALRRNLQNVETGVFGAMMGVELINDGPVTLILEKTPKQSDPRETRPSDME